MLGPLFSYDLVRLSRRGRSTLLRCVYASALLAALFVAYQSRFPRHDLLAAPLASPASIAPSDMARLATDFVYAILWMQTIAIYVLTPAYLASAIAEEKERNTLNLLFTTHLSDREIVLGKLMARLTHLAAILLAGAPLLILTRLWGGVEMHALLAAFVVTALNLLSVGAICMFCSVQCRSVLAAVLASYALTALFVGVPLLYELGGAMSPHGVFQLLTEPEEVVNPLWAAISPPARPRLEFFHVLFGCAYHGIAGFIFACVAVGTLRAAAGLRHADAIDKTPPVILQGTHTSNAAYAEMLDAPAALGDLPAVGNWPLLWKESHHGRRGPYAIPAVLPLTALAAAVLFVALLPDGRALPQSSSSEEFAPHVAVLLLAGLWCTVVAFQSAAGISRERDQGTFEGLLTLPVARPALLGAKWLGPILYSSACGCLLAFVFFIGLLTKSLHPIGVALLIAAIAAHIAFFASLGVVLSLGSRNTLWARITMTMMLLGFLAVGLRSLMADLRAAARVSPPVAPVSAAPLSPSIAPSWASVPWRELIAEVGANIPGAWWFLAFSPDTYARAIAAGDPQFAGRLIIAECGILGYALAARLLWAFACWRFRGAQRTSGGR